MEWKIEGELSRSASGSTFGYSLEARMNYHTPKNVLGILLDNRWRRIDWRENIGGPGNPRPFYRQHELDALNLLTLNEAQALRWNFICAADAQTLGGSLCLETRIVKHKVEYSRKETPVEYFEPRDCRGDVPEDMRATLPETSHDPA